jgi:putative NADH-flavin reductase
MQDVIRVLRGAGIRRAIFVMGAGSLLMPDGRTWYAHNLERGTAPPTSGPAVAAYEALCTVEDFDWTAVSPAAKIEAGQRTAKFRKGLDHLLQDASGDSRISYEDLAVAILDEAESAAHVRRRLTVAY